MTVRLVLLACFAICRSTLAAEPPTIERLSPPGGQRGSTFEVKFTGKAGDGDLKIISEPDSFTFALNEPKDGASVTISPTARPGIHWLRFSNQFGATELKPFIVGLIPEVTEKEPNAKIAEAQQVAQPSVTVNGVLENGTDVDTFAVQLSKGQTIVATMQARQILGSPMDAVLQVVNQKGTVLDQNDDDVGFDPRLAFVAPADGTWFIRTFAFPAAPNSSISFSGGADYVYRLTLSTEPVVEHTEPLVRFSGDTASVLTLHGWNTGSMTLSLPADKSMLDSGVALPVRIGISDIPVAVESQLAADRLLTLPVAVTGHLLANETDSYVFNAAASQKFSVSVQARAMGSLLDAVATLHDKDGKLISEADDINGDNPDVDMRLTIPADGQYRLTIRDRYQNAGDRFYYLLKCRETVPTFAATLATTAFTFSTDKPLEVPVSIERRDGFAEAIDFRVEGLPEGIAAECPRSEKDGDSSKAVTLKLSGAAKEPFQGAIRIVAESVDSKAIQPVSFIAGDGLGVHELWLTVPAAAPAASGP